MIIFTRREYFILRSIKRHILIREPVLSELNRLDRSSLQNTIRVLSQVV